jgi:hypothetical protein
MLIHLANTVIPWIVGAEILSKGFLEGVGLLSTILKWFKKKRNSVKVKTVAKKYVAEEKRHKKSETAEEKKHEHREMEDFKEIEKLAEKKSKFKRK